jgi:hypothetical protein
MQSARAAVALLALLAIDAPAQDVSGSFVVDVEVSPAAASGYVAQFRVHDAQSHRLVAERAIAYAGDAQGAVTVGASGARKCSSDGAQGYCLQLVVGKGSDRRSTDAFISRDGEMRLAAARPAR